jgi:hypothetical protein
MSPTSTAQKQPYKPNELHKFDKGLRITDPEQHPGKFEKTLKNY